MIELIFVIVILGILAAVAIPKLAATRDDAKIAKAVSEVATAVSDIGAYYTAQGKFGTMREMTNVKFSNADSNLTLAPSYQVNTTNCIDFNTTAAALADGNISVSMATGITSTDTGDEALCYKIQQAVAGQDLNKTHSFGGQKVVW